MNDEIKEIFDTKLYFDLEEEDYIKIKDYITNLQQEIQKKEAMYDSLAVDYRLAQEENERLKEDKKKAADYVKEHIRIDDEYPAYMEMLIEERDNLLNILQNGSDNNFKMLEKCYKAEKNWNSLREWLIKEIDKSQKFPIQDVERVSKRIGMCKALNKMNELEGNDSEC